MSTPLRDAYPEMQARGADVVAIGTGDTRYARAFVADEKAPFLVLVDDARAAAHTAAVRTSTFPPMFSPQTWRATRATWKRGNRIHKAGMRVTRMGATFIVQPPGTLAFEHVDADSTDHTSIEPVLAPLV